MGNEQQTFQQFLETAAADIGKWEFLVNLVVAGVLSQVVAWVYVRFGRSLTNRESLARNFVLVGMTTMIIISIVKSSLALSLGLVGALSIVRFRTAVKEPEELAYLFLVIAIGLGMGASQVLVTVLGVLVVLTLVVLKSARHESSSRASNLYLVVEQAGGVVLTPAELVETIKAHCRSLNLVRFDESKSGAEASFMVEFDDLSKLEAARRALRDKTDSATISFVDNEGVA